MMKKTCTLYFSEGKLKFSSGHSTIFSATNREPLHGHNYTVEVKMEAEMGEPGIILDYRVLEAPIIALCDQLNWHCLMPTKSPYLAIEDDGEHYQITFDKKSMWLLKTDVVLLPLENVTLETLSQWFVDQLTQNKAFMQTHRVHAISVKVFNGPHHAAESCCN